MSDTTITFWGAAETVTGSRFLVEHAGRRVLVDCGLFQGVKRLRERNWARFPVDPSLIDAVVLTHAHIDHAGYLPALVRDGFEGDIWCTPSTEALSQIMLLDSAHLHEEDARWHNRHRTSKHHPALPLYTTADAETALRHFRTVPFGEEFSPIAELRGTFSPVGHILGAASVHLDNGSGSVSFTGDVGRPNDPIMRPPSPLVAADHIVTESTYGDRSHPRTEPMEVLAAIVNRTISRGGSLVVPVFAVGRAQTMLHLLSELRRAGAIPDVPTYLNSPMAVNATELFVAHPEEHRLTAEQCKQMTDDVELVRDARQSKRLTSSRHQMIVLAGSGMATGGRVLHHLEVMAPDHRNTVLLTGFQAAGTRGEAMQHGARHVKLFGTYVPVGAEVATIDGLSAHADADELVAWLGRTTSPPSSVSVVHGEPAAADTVRRRITDELGWDASVPGHGEQVPVTRAEPS